MDNTRVGIKSDRGNPTAVRSKRALFERAAESIVASKAVKELLTMGEKNGLIAFRLASSGFSLSLSLEDCLENCLDCKLAGASIAWPTSLLQENFNLIYQINVSGRAP